MMRKTVLLTMTTFLAGLFLAAGTFGAGEKMMDKSMSATGQGIIHTDLHSANQFIGTEVRDASGNEIGEVKDLMFDFDRGIGYAVVESEDLTAVDKRFLVPLSAFTSGHEGEYVTLSVSKDKLAQAPIQESGMTDETYGRMLHEHYGVSYPWADLPGDVPIRQSETPAENLTYPGNRPVIPERR